MSEKEMRIIEEASKQSTEGMFIEDLKFLEEHQGAFKAYKAFRSVRKEDALNRRLGLKVLLAFVIILLLSFTAYHLLKGDSETPATYQFALLPDGSEIQLMGNATYTFNKETFLNNRKVTLEGSAFFDIKHDEASPFEVEIGGTSIEVLGTSFYVLDGSKEVFVRDGLVRVSKGNSSILLEKGEGVNHAGDKLEVIHVNPPQSRLFSKSYDNVPLIEVMNDLAEFSDLDIEFDEALKGCYYNGSFELVTVKEVLDELSILFELEYSFTKQEVKILSATCQ